MWRNLRSYRTHGIKSPHIADGLETDAVQLQSAPTTGRDTYKPHRPKQSHNLMDLQKPDHMINYLQLLCFMLLFHCNLSDHKFSVA